MKKVKTDTLRAEYQREDFGEMVRGKYAAQMSEASNVIVLNIPTRSQPQGHELSCPSPDC